MSRDISLSSASTYRAVQEELVRENLEAEAVRAQFDPLT